MKKTTQKNMRIYAVAALLILIAAALRLATISPAYPVLRFIRSFGRASIHIGLLCAWGISVQRRVVQKQARRYLLCIATLMILWIVIRSIKFFIAEDPAVLRQLWYLYYFPMLFIPLLFLFVAHSLGRPEDFCLPRWTALLYIPTAALLLLVLTNDLHQLVFAFPADIPVWSDHNHSYGVGYYMVAAWMLLCALTAFIFMIRKCRVPHTRTVLFLPFIPMAATVLYGVLYVIRFAPLYYFMGDITIAYCLLFTAILESCIQCGLIQSNTHYADFFAAITNINAQITDEKYVVCYSSHNALALQPQQLKAAEQASVLLDGGTVLHNMPIRNGHAIWTEDISELLHLRENLEATQEELKDRNDRLQYLYDREKEHKMIEEQNRLYDLLQSKTQSQFNQISHLTRAYRESPDEAQRQTILAQIVVLGSFIKRRKDLVLSIDSTPTLQESKLTGALQESFRALHAMGVHGGFLVQTEQNHLPGRLLALAYDFFEAVIEQDLDTLRFCNVRVHRVDGVLRIMMLTNCRCSFDPLLKKYPQTLIESDDEGTTLMLPLELEKEGIR